jgi:N-acyl-D-amino-acid deacylase
MADTSLHAQAPYDVILRGGLVFDGSGGAPVRGDVAIISDRIAAVGELANARAPQELDVSGLAVAPDSSTC